MTCGPASGPNRMSNSRDHVLGRGVRIVRHSTPHAIEMPVTFELVLVVAIGGIQDWKRPGVVALAEHPRRYHFSDFEAVSVVETSAKSKAPDVLDSCWRNPPSRVIWVALPPSPGALQLC